MEIGAQLYTLREFCKDTDGIAETLKRVADIGYKNVQVSGIAECDLIWLRNELDKNGLKCVATHNNRDKLMTEPETIIKDNDILGCNYVGLGAYSFTEEEPGKGFENYISVFTPTADAVAKSGKYFMHHNHAWEFKKYQGKIVLEQLAERFDADKLGFIIDTYWVQRGGGDPAYWIERMSGRVPCIHLKDYAYDAVMAPVGEGNINFDRVFEKAEAAGTKYMLVEQDNCYGENPFDCMKRSYDYLVARGFK